MNSPSNPVSTKITSVTQVDSRVLFVLSHTSHPGNIGAAARAMKVMGFERLALVNPKAFPAPEAETLASRATDVLERASVHSQLADAMKAATLSFAFTARPRDLSTPALTMREAAQMARQHLAANAAHEMACVFGNETYGLSNDEVMLATHRVYIPANPAYSSLNLSQAVQIAAYELQHTLIEFGLPVEEREAAPINPAPHEDLDGLLRHIERAAVASGFLNPAEPKRLMQRLWRMFQRAQPEREEIAILRGMLSAQERAMEKSQKP